MDNMDSTKCRGIRGATTADENTPDAILSATEELLERLIVENNLHSMDIAAMIFSATPDINAAFPAKAARNIGWHEVAAFGTQEIDVPGALPLCIRILILANTDRNQAEIKHVYLRGAIVLRPDRAR